MEDDLPRDDKQVTTTHQSGKDSRHMRYRWQIDVMWLAEATALTTDIDGRVIEADDRRSW